jgi:hypothetical protein
MMILFYRQDWEEIATLVRIREGLQKVEDGDDSLESLRLVENNNGTNNDNGSSLRYGSTDLQ